MLPRELRESPHNPGSYPARPNQLCGYGAAPGGFRGNSVCPGSASKSSEKGRRKECQSTRSPPRSGGPRTPSGGGAPVCRLEPAPGGGRCLLFQAQPIPATAYLGTTADTLKRKE